jgi:3-keto-5-aminohexanoate cleavage enzyme
LLDQHKIAIGEIRSRAAPLLWNTFPLGGDCERRFQLFRDLAAEPATRPDLGAHDIGSLNIVSFDRHGKKAASTTYVNTFDDVCYFMSGFRNLGLKPFLNIFEPGFIRTALVCKDLDLIDEPLLFKFYFSDEYGLPPSKRSIEMYLEMLEGVRHEWFGCYIGGDVLPFVSLIASMGGHVRVGLEDYDYKHDGQLSNAAIVDQAIKQVQESGRPIANVHDAVEILGM